jgi:hypothetical protein
MVRGLLLTCDPHDRTNVVTVLYPPGAYRSSYNAATRLP